MDREALPFLQCLRATVSTMSNALPKSSPLAMPSGIIERLLDRMIAESTVGARLREEYVVAVAALAAELDGLPGPRTASAADAISEITRLARDTGAASYDRLNGLVAQVQSDLRSVQTTEARALTKRLMGLEAEYCGRMYEAIITQIDVSAASKTAPAVSARNVREVDPAAMSEFLRRKFPDDAGLHVERSQFISGGYSKFTVGLSLGNARSIPREVILRADASSTFGGASVTEEYPLLAALHEHGVAVSKPLALETGGSVFGSPFMLVERKPGTIIGNMFALPPPNRSVCEDAAAKLAAIHLVPFSALTGRLRDSGIRSSEKALVWIEEGERAWRQLRMPSPVFETAFDWLRRNAHRNDRAPRTLVHGDYGLNNLLIEDGRISAVLDWEFAHAGNPAYDLGYFYFMAERLSSWREFLDAYGRSGMPIPEEDQLNYHVLFAATRLGVMLCQTTGPFLSGAAPDLPGAYAVGGGFYEQTIARIAGALDRVL